MNWAATLGHVAVLLGGTSAEREVSLKSGGAVTQALQRQGVEVIAVDPADAGWIDQLSGCDRVVISLHGVGGEDGRMQGLLESLGLPYTGSGVMASAIGMDKWRTKLLWSAMGLPTPAYRLLDAQTDWEQVIAELGAVIVKPAHEGSSIGMSRASTPAELYQAWQQASRFDGLVFAEQWVNGEEYTVALLDGEALPPIRLETPNSFYDYEAKYLANTTRYHCPAGLDEATEGRLRELAKQAFTVVGCRHWGRVDFMRDPEQGFFLLEVNTSPGMTDHSLVPMAARQAGIDFDELVCRLANLASLEQTA